MCGILAIIQRKSEPEDWDDVVVTEFNYNNSGNWHLMSEDASAQLKQFDHFLEARGPDQRGYVLIDTQYYRLFLASSLLQLRGAAGASSPLQERSFSNILLYNGEIFGGRDVDVVATSGIQYSDHERLQEQHAPPTQRGRYGGVRDQQYVLGGNRTGKNDGEYLMERLGKCDFVEHGQEHQIDENIKRTLSQLHGPWSIIYWNRRTQTLWFGKDCLGRRSLLININPELQQVKENEEVDQQNDKKGSESIPEPSVEESDQVFQVPRGKMALRSYNGLATKQNKNENQYYFNNTMNTLSLNAHILTLSSVASIPQNQATDKQTQERNHKQGSSECLNTYSPGRKSYTESDTGQLGCEKHKLQGQNQYEYASQGERQQLHSQSHQTHQTEASQQQPKFKEIVPGLYKILLSSKQAECFFAKLGARDEVCSTGEADGGRQKQLHQFCIECDQWQDLNRKQFLASIQRRNVQDIKDNGHSLVLSSAISEKYRKPQYQSEPSKDPLTSLTQCNLSKLASEINKQQMSQKLHPYLQAQCDGSIQLLTNITETGYMNTHPLEQERYIRRYLWDMLSEIETCSSYNKTIDFSGFTVSQEKPSNTPVLNNFHQYKSARQYMPNIIKTLNFPLKTNSQREDRLNDNSQMSVAKPGKRQPGDHQSGDHQPGDHQPGDHQPGDHQSGDHQPGDHQPGDHQPGDYQPGDYQPGDHQPGDYQPGDYQPGDQQPGDYQPDADKPVDHQPEDHQPDSVRELYRLELHSNNQCQTTPLADACRGTPRATNHQCTQNDKDSDQCPDKQPAPNNSCKSRPRQATLNPGEARPLAMPVSKPYDRKNQQLNYLDQLFSLEYCYIRDYSDCDALDIQHLLDTNIYSRIVRQPYREEMTVNRSNDSQSTALKSSSSIESILHEWIQLRNDFMADSPTYQMPSGDKVDTVAQIFTDLRNGKPFLNDQRTTQACKTLSFMCRTYIKMVEFVFVCDHFQAVLDITLALLASVSKRCDAWPISHHMDLKLAEALQHNIKNCNESGFKATQFTYQGLRIPVRHSPSLDSPLVGDYTAVGDGHAVGDSPAVGITPAVDINPAVGDKPAVDINPSVGDKPAVDITPAVSDNVASGIPSTQRPPSCNSDSHFVQRKPFVTVLFSGGVDSTLLAAFTHFSVPLGVVIRLPNVCFKNGQSPDRRTGWGSAKELAEWAPQRQWQFVEVNSSLEQVDVVRSRLQRLLAPADTLMDLNISAALWMAVLGSSQPIPLPHQTNTTSIELTHEPAMNTTLSTETHQQPIPLPNQTNTTIPNSIDSTHQPAVNSTPATETHQQPNMSSNNTLTPKNTLENDDQHPQLAATSQHAVQGSTVQGSTVQGSTVQDNTAHCAEEQYFTRHTCAHRPTSQDYKTAGYVHIESYEVRNQYGQAVCSVNVYQGHNKTQQRFNGQPSTRQSPNADVQSGLPRASDVHYPGTGQGPQYPDAQDPSAYDSQLARSKADGDPQQIRLKTEGDPQQTRPKADGDPQQTRLEADDDPQQTRLKAENDPQETRQNAESDLQQTGSKAEGDPQQTRLKVEGDRRPYRETVVLVGHGADEVFGGYSRYRTKFREQGMPGLQAEMEYDMSRFWKRNLGRDDRVIADRSVEARHPFLDEALLQVVAKLPVCYLTDLKESSGGGDKMILRCVLKMLGLGGAAGNKKTAIQFGTRIGQLSNQRLFGSNRRANKQHGGAAKMGQFDGQ